MVALDVVGVDVVGVAVVGAAGDRICATSRVHPVICDLYGSV